MYNIKYVFIVLAELRNPAADFAAAGALYSVIERGKPTG
jgi:hypothetical protein